MTWPIRELYDIEDRGKRLPADERRALRERESRLMLQRIRAFVDHLATVRVPPKSAFDEALSYLRNHWDALQTYVPDGRMPIDNNDDERLMKQIAVGRKNWMFVGSLEAGARAGTLMTIISTAARNDLDVYVYVKDVLDQLLAGSTDYCSLHADVSKQSHPEAVRSYRTDERRDAADRRRHSRAQRRLAKRSAANLSSPAPAPGHLGAGARLRGCGPRRPCAPSLASNVTSVIDAKLHLRCAIHNPQ